MDHLEQLLLRCHGSRLACRGCCCAASRSLRSRSSSRLQSTYLLRSLHPIAAPATAKQTRITNAAVTTAVSRPWGRSRCEHLALSGRCVSSSARNGNTTPGSGSRHRDGRLRVGFRYPTWAVRRPGRRAPSGVCEAGPSERDRLFLEPVDQFGRLPGREVFAAVDAVLVAEPRAEHTDPALLTGVLGRERQLAV